MTAMCKRCLKSASEDARKCTSCGGTIVRFSETGEVTEVEVASADEPAVSNGIPPLFGDLASMYAPVPGFAASMPAPPPPPARVGTSAPHQMPHGYSTPPHGVSQPAGGSYTPIASNPHTHTRGMVAAQQGPHSASPQSSAVDNPPIAIEPRTAFLMPAAQLDDVVDQILSPFGFEHAEPASPIVQNHVPPAVADSFEHADPPRRTEPVPVPAQPAITTIEDSVAALEQPEAPGTQPESSAEEVAMPIEGDVRTGRHPAVEQTPARGTSADADTLERALAMAELARDIMSISSDSPRPETTSRPIGDEDETSAPPATPVGNASPSLDLVIGPAHKGKLRRSKPAISKDRFLAADGLVPNGEYGDEDRGSPEAQEKPKGRARLKLR